MASIICLQVTGRKIKTVALTYRYVRVLWEDLILYDFFLCLLSLKGHEGRQSYSRSLSLHYIRLNSAGAPVEILRVRWI